MADQPVAIDGPKLEAELQAVLKDVRALVADRDALAKRLARLKADSLAQVIQIQAQRDAYEVAMLAAIDDGCECDGCETLRAAVKGKTGAWDKAKRAGWIEAANFLDTCGHTAYGRTLRREAGWRWRE